MTRADHSISAGIGAVASCAALPDGRLSGRILAGGVIVLALSVTKIFISYRRSDTKLIVGRMFDKLKEKFGRDGVFVDIDSIPSCIGTN